jgi:hypothetical protein
MQQNHPGLQPLRDGFHFVSSLKMGHLRVPIIDKEEGFVKGHASLAVREHR